MALVAILVISPYHGTPFSKGKKSSTGVSIIHTHISSNITKVNQKDKKRNKTAHSTENNTQKNNTQNGVSQGFRYPGRGSILPRPLFKSQPAYPRSMKPSGITGLTTVEIGITKEGAISYKKIIQSLGKTFDKTVITWLNGKRFTPALDSSGRPFACRVHLPVRFVLE